MAEQIGLAGELDLSGWSSQVGKYNNDLTGMIGNTSKAAGGLGASWNTMGQSVLKATGLMTGALAAGAAAAGAAIIGVGVSAFNASADFEAATNRMTSQLGLTEAGAQNFDATMRNVFANNFGESIDDVAQSLVDVEMAFGRIGGTQGVGELQFATEAAIALRDAFGVEVVESTNAAVELMDKFGISSEQAFDMLTTGFQSGLNSSDDFLDTIGEYSTQFANGGASVDEFFSLMESGLQGGMLGTDKAADAFKEFGVRIADGSKTTAESLAMLGLNVDTITAGMTDGTITTADAFQMVQEALQATDDPVLKMQAGVGLLGTQFEDLGMDVATALDMTNDWSERSSGAVTSLNTQYATFGQAVAGMWRRLVVAITPFTDVLLDLVNKAMPHVMKAFDSFEGHLNTLIGYLSEVASTGNFMNDWLDEMSPPLATVVQGTLALAGAIGGALQGAFSFIQEHADAFKGALMGIGVVLAGAAITAGIAAMAAAIATLVSPIGLIILAAAGLGIAWNTNFLGIRDTTLEVVAAITTAFEPLTEAISEFGSGALAEIQTFVTGNETEFTNLKGIWDGLTESITGIVTKIQEQFPQLAPLFVGFGVAVQLISMQVQAQLTLLSEAFSALVTGIKAIIDGDWTLAWQSAQDLAGAFITYVQTTFANLSEVFTPVFTTLTTLITTTFAGLPAIVSAQLPLWTGALSSWGIAAWGWITNAMAGVRLQMAAWGTAILGYVSENLPIWIARLASWGMAAWGWITNAMAGVRTQMAAWGAAVLDYVVTNLPTWISNLAAWTTAAWEWIVDAAGPLLTALGGWFVSLTGYLALSLPTWISSFADWTKAAWEWIVDAAIEVPGKLGEWYTEITTALGPHLTTFGTEMEKWATELVDWIIGEEADPVANLGTWLQGIIDWIPTGVTLLGVETLKLATALLEWIDENAVDAIGALGTWLGKIVAWIPLGVIALGIEVVKLAGALVGWIMGGTGGVTVDQSAAGQLDTEFGKFQEALLGALEGIKEGFITGVQNFVRAFADTLSEYIDWEFVGRNIMAFVRNGMSSMVEPIEKAIGALATAAKNSWDTFVDWLQTGKDVIQGVIDGFGDMLESVTTKIGEIVTAIVEAFTSEGALGKLKQAGKDIIDGLLDGLEANAGAITGWFTTLFSGIWDSVSDFWQTESPSKLMMGLGEDIIDGWVLGMANNDHRVYEAMRKISLGVSRIAHRAGQDAIGAFNSALGKFSSIVGDEDSGLGVHLHGEPYLQNLLQRQQGRLNFLKLQSDIVGAVRDAGIDPADALAGLTLGADADVTKLAGVVGKTMERLNSQLEQALKNSVSGLDTTIEEMRASRKSIQDIEKEFADQHLGTLGNYARQLEGIDAQIAKAEEQVLRTGGAGMHWLQLLEYQRGQLLEGVRKFHEQRQELDTLLNRLPVSTNQRAQDAIERWRERMIDPLLAGFEQLSAAGRSNVLQMVAQRMATIADFANKAPLIVQAEARAMSALEGFGEGARNRIENLLSLIYNPANLASLDRNIDYLQEFAGGLNHIKSTLQTAAMNRISTETIMERMLGSFDQLTNYKNAIAAIDKQIESAQAAAMASGQMWGVNTVQGLDIRRADAQAELETFIRQTQQLEDVISGVKNLAGPGQNAAERFLQEAIQPIMDAFGAPMRSIEREAWIRTAQERVQMLNRFVDQMRALERVQGRVAGNAFFTHLEDDFAKLQDISLSDTMRANLIGQLDRYITQMMRLQSIQRDISVGRGINPIVDRFASQRLDAIAKQLEDINLTEMQRNQLIEQYRVEQEKVLRLQEKQQQLSFIQEQLDLIGQLRDLDDIEGWSLNVDDIISGISFGVNASIDDLMALTTRVLDELVRYANHQLGIASPSRVFAKIGTNIMAGLEQGILAGMRYPMNALRNATGNLVPYSLGSKTLSVNMGGVTISNGMDDVMFEARVRQIVQSEFAR